MSKNKNISKSIPNGTILQTRDEYFYNQGSYRKPGYANKGNYRMAVVIDSNRNDELAIVKLYSNSGTTLNNTISKYKPFVETLDNQNNRIKINRKFIKSKKKLTKDNISKIKKDCFNNPKSRYKNRKKVHTMKGRK